MSAKRLVLIGGGGHGRMVLEAAQPAWPDIVICDDAPDLVGTTILGARVVGDKQWLAAQPTGTCEVIVAVGINAVRAQLLDWVATSTRTEIVSIIHPSAIVSPSASIGGGVFIAPGAIIGAGARLERGAILNTAASVDHDCIIGDCAHIGPGAHLCGDIRIGARTLIGVGASVRPSTRIGQNCVVGAGAAVVHDLDDETTALGVPARPHFDRHPGV